MAGETELKAIKISQLPSTSTINDNDIFVLEQGGTAKKLSGKQLTDFVGSSVSSIKDHSELTGRDKANQHTIGAIEGLQNILDSIPQPMSAEELKTILTDGGI